jgi:hypothetical protein
MDFDPKHPNTKHPIFLTFRLFEGIMEAIKDIALLGTLTTQEDATLADISDAVQNLENSWATRNFTESVANPGKALPPVTALQVCGKFFGEEILAFGMKPGTGMRKCCLLWKGHKGDCDDQNPELDRLLDLTYEDGSLG